MSYDQTNKQTNKQTNRQTNRDYNFICINTYLKILNFADFINLINVHEIK